jgi:hypothetical protein
MLLRIEGQGEVNRIFRARNLGFIDMNCILDSPIQDFLIVPALVAGVEVGVWGMVSLNPVPCDHRHVGIAHGILSDHFDAVICDVYGKQEAHQ